MNDLVTDFVAWLATKASLTAGRDIFRHQFAEIVEGQPQPDAMAVVIPTGGPARAYKAPDFPATFQIKTRAATLAKAQELAWKLFYGLMDADSLPARNVNLSADWRAVAIDPIQPPSDLGLSEGNQHQAVFNVQLRVARRKAS